MAQSHHQRRDQRHTRNRGQRGAGTLELAFFLMPSLALICGFLDVGMALFTWNTLQNAVREGTRYAITYQYNNGSTQSASIKTVVSTWAMGLVQAGSSANNSNVPYIDINFYAPPTAANPNGSALPLNSSANAPGNIVEVSIKNYPYSWMAPFSGAIGGALQPAFYATPGSQLQIAVYSADVLGGAPVGGTPPL